MYKNVHFTFSNKTYIQNDGVAMGSSLDQPLANVFVVELEAAFISSHEFLFSKLYLEMLC